MAKIIVKPSPVRKVAASTYAGIMSDRDPRTPVVRSIMGLESELASHRAQVRSLEASLAGYRAKVAACESALDQMKTKLDEMS